MKKIILFLTLFFLGFNSKGQTTNSILDKIADTLLSTGVDTLLLYHPHQRVSPRFPSEFCGSTNRNYLIWRKNNKIWLLKSADCYKEDGSSLTEIISNPITLDTVFAFDFVLTNFDVIKNETIFPATIKIKIGEHYAYYNYKTTHPIFTLIKIFTKDGKILKSFPDTDLYDGILRNDDGSIRETLDSVNYDYNTSTFLYRLSILLESLIDKLEKDKTIKF